MLNTQHLWQSLKEMALYLSQQKISALFSNNPLRVPQLSLSVGDIYFDFSKNFITTEILDQLIALAEAKGLAQAITQLYSGYSLNNTERKAVLHTALRSESTKVVINGVDIVGLIQEQKKKMYEIVEKVQQGKWLGGTQRAITDVVNLGIGGSDLGPAMAVEALAHYQSGAVNIHFVSNIDPQAISQTLKLLDPQTTLFIISSKSFSTPETLSNAAIAKEWLGGKWDYKNHFIAVTASPEKAYAFGVDPAHVLIFGDWVGGRYSIWSAIGLPLALSIGSEHFEAFLKGARWMDQHFATAPFARNVPVLLALIGIWYINFWNAPTLAVLPYAHGLRRLADYLQQLDMESNGKSVNREGAEVAYATGPIVWGQAGTNGQHAFYQLLHQGTHFIPVDFILFAKGATPFKAQHQQLVANCLAQAQALMQGNEDNSLIPQEQMKGNKPSNILLFPKLTPYTLGQLLALYEHKVFVQGVIWNINSFDQPGVELGKKLAQDLIQSLEDPYKDPGLDPSTQALIVNLKTK